VNSVETTRDRRATSSVAPIEGIIENLMVQLGHRQLTAVETGASSSDADVRSKINVGHSVSSKKIAVAASVMKNVHIPICTKQTHTDDRDPNDLTISDDDDDVVFIAEKNFAKY
jgi:hypothetical protein